MRILYVLILLFLAGCGDNYSLDEKRGPNPEGIVTTHPLSLPPDYMLRAPEPVKPASQEKDGTVSDGQTEKKETTETRNLPDSEAEIKAADKKTEE